MKLNGLQMPPFNTTLMGVVKGTLDYYQIQTSDAGVFGASGHAFLINVHKQLCPSGPYCWNLGRMQPLLANLGLLMERLGFFSAESTPAERAALEERVRHALDGGAACSLLNMENQLIAGYDSEGFDLLRPWPCNPDFPPGRLSFGTWSEFGREVHVTFFILQARAPADRRQAVLDALEYAVDLYRHPSEHSLDPYGAGPAAYAGWIEAVADHGASHGHWWNAMVWSECRAMASGYFKEILAEGLLEKTSPLPQLYGEIAGALRRAGGKELDAAEKRRFLEEARDLEAVAIEEVAALADSLRAGTRA